MILLVSLLYQVPTMAELSQIAMAGVTRTADRGAAAAEAAAAAPPHVGLEVVEDAIKTGKDLVATQVGCGWDVMLLLMPVVLS